MALIPESGRSAQRCDFAFISDATLIERSFRQLSQDSRVGGHAVFADLTEALVPYLRNEAQAAVVHALRQPGGFEAVQRTLRAYRTAPMDVLREGLKHADIPISTWEWVIRQPLTDLIELAVQSGFKVRALAGNEYRRQTLRALVDGSRLQHSWASSVVSDRAVEFLEAGHSGVFRNEPGTNIFRRATDRQ